MTKQKLVHGNKRTMEYIGEDNFSNPIYRCVENDSLWKDIALGESEIPQLYDCGNEIDGDPGFPIRPELELHFISKPPSKENKFNYMMLSRMQSDCEYYLNYGNRSKNRLYYEDEQRHIDEMRKLHNAFPEDGKPEWLTMEQIEQYEVQMVSVKCPSCGELYSISEWNNNTFEIVSNLNNSDDPITSYHKRKEGTLYRCPNQNCEDEVITDSNLCLKVQDSE
jgi:predicted RNA-binding Zn-ribbon protein involved in translation (DUF1610 family)